MKGLQIKKNKKQNKTKIQKLYIVSLNNLNSNFKWQIYSMSQKKKTAISSKMFCWTERV